MKQKTLCSVTLGGILAGSLLAALPAQADIAEAAQVQEENGVLQSYRRLLPLEGSSNFRDLGGYKTEEGKRVRRGLLYRSGVMTSLTEKDEQWLEQLDMDTVVDLRSREELSLFPNHWVEHADIDYVTHDYSIMDMLPQENGEIDVTEMEGLYNNLAYGIVPQLTMYFEQLVDGAAPIAVNCSAGQDRTGVASSLLLTALGVPREVVMEDYLLSSDFRRPRIERGNVNLEAAAEDNAFAALMAHYSEEEVSQYAEPLVTAEGEPLLAVAFRQIEQDYGSIEAFMEQELGVDESDIATLRQLYLE